MKARKIIQTLDLTRDPEGVNTLEDWIEKNPTEWDIQQEAKLQTNVPFSFRFGKYVIIVKDGKVGHLKQWCRALGLNYETAVRRRQLGWPVEKVLATTHQGFTDHVELPLSKRLICPCVACKCWVLGHNLHEESKQAKKRPSALVEGSPNNVAEPELWKKTISGEYCFKHMGKYKTVEEWAEWAQIPRDTLYARLVAYGMPIRKAIKEKITGPKHGTRACYQYYKCRCEACRKANSAYPKTPGH